MILSYEMDSELHCLIIDDQPESIRGLAEQLAGRGHQVSLSADSMESLRLLTEAQTGRRPYGLVLVDVNLPIMDGPTLVREIRRRGDQTPVVFITGYHSVSMRMRPELASLQALDILTKPVPMTALDRCLEQLLRQSRSSNQERRSSEFGLGSGHHSAIGLGAANADLNEPFYGTSRSVRIPKAASPPTEGALAHVQRPPSDNDIIPDSIITGGNQTPLPSTANTARRGMYTPLPLPMSDPVRNDKRPAGSASVDFLLTPPAGSSDSGRRYPECTPMATPMIGIRDPVTGEYKRRQSRRFAADHLALEALKPAVPKDDPSGPITSKRFRRSLTDRQPASQQAQLDPATRPPTGTSTSIIRRGLGTPPRAQSVPEIPPCMVACAHCQGQFTVPDKALAYTAVCVHCGQLNRIDPL